MAKVFDKPGDLLGSEGTKLGPTEWMEIAQIGSTGSPR